MTSDAPELIGHGISAGEAAAAGELTVRGEYVALTSRGRFDVAANDAQAGRPRSARSPPAAPPVASSP